MAWHGAWLSLLLTPGTYTHWYADIKFRVLFISCSGGGWICKLQRSSQWDCWCGNGVHYQDTWSSHASGCGYSSYRPNCHRYPTNTTSYASLNTNRDLCYCKFLALIWVVFCLFGLFVLYIYCLSKSNWILSDCSIVDFAYSWSWLPGQCISCHLSSWRRQQCVFQHHYPTRQHCGVQWEFPSDAESP